MQSFSLSLSLIPSVHVVPSVFLSPSPCLESSFSLSYSENLFIQDAFIRGFSKEHLGGYGGLRRYATHTEDHELEGKLMVVERYHTRMPDLIKRIYSSSEGSPDRAGEGTGLKDGG